MKVLLTGGGTGGHVYPALAVAGSLLERADGEPVEFLFAGPTRGDTARLCMTAGVPFAAVRAAPVRGRSPGVLLRSVWELGRGTAHAWLLVGRFKPRVVLATGGYASIPVSLAARLHGVPLVLYLPDIHPGWAARLLARLSKRIAVSADGALAHLPAKKTVVTGYPVRPAFFAQDRVAARRALALGDGLPLLLVTGATLGSQAINLAVWDALPRLLERCAVLHQTGPQGAAAGQQLAESLSEPLRQRYRVLPYLDNMPAAMAAADLAVMRSGGSSLGEPAAAALPAILVPGRFHGGEQQHNAAFMATRGAAVLLDEENLAELAALALDLLAKPGRLAAMRAAASALARPRAAQAIADVLLEVAA